MQPMNKVRQSQGQFYTLITCLRIDEEKLFSYFRMSSSSFHELVAVVRDNVAKQDTRLKLSVLAKERLAVTLK